jgi:hypothetical protein
VYYDGAKILYERVERSARWTAKFTFILVEIKEVIYNSAISNFVWNTLRKLGREVVKSFTAVIHGGTVNCRKSNSCDHFAGNHVV